MAIALSASGALSLLVAAWQTEQFASLICSQLKIGLAHRGAKTSGRECDLLQILYDDYIVSQRKQMPGNELSGVHHVTLFTIKLSECEICLTFRC